MPSLKCYKRKSGLRGKAEREDIIEPNILFEQMKERIFISFVDRVIMLSRSKSMTADYDQKGIFTTTRGSIVQI